MTSRTPSTWNWIDIDVFDLYLDVLDKSVGPAALVDNPYPFLTTSRVQKNAREVKSLKTSSIDTIATFGKGLKNLTSLVYTVKIGTVGEISYRWLAGHAGKIDGLPPTMVTLLRSWAQKMMRYGDRSTEILVNALRSNPNLSSVTLQLQENHSYEAIVSNLAGLNNLRSLSIGGSDLYEADDEQLQSTTDTVLDILTRCRSLDALTFNAIPMSTPVVQDHSIYFTSPITVLDLSGVRRRHERGWDIVCFYPIHVHRIVPLCPNLRLLSLPRHLHHEEIDAMTPILSMCCQGLRSLYFNSSNLRVPPFKRFMESMTSLKALNITDCEFDASDFESWLGSSVVQETLQSLIVTHDELDQSPECNILLLKMPEGGTLNSSRTTWSRRRHF
ncbi:hypothetical protein B0O80DRAFT_425144 [Mortierella sp. GBAus27b]|nr:hypothetical protein BGX31_010709 [Mortierella sp. GBA43]KAI8356258.1 hypothetical protein B0O80DRAFT_425144 [Mortierella sp. GBAus27b]